jgi:hypothetical protein
MIEFIPLDLSTLQFCLTASIVWASQIIIREQRQGKHISIYIYLALRTFIYKFHIELHIEKRTVHNF